MRGSGENRTPGNQQKKPSRYAEFRAKDFIRRMQRYVELRAEGSNVEQLINICLRRNLDVWNVKKRKDHFTLCMSVRAFKKNIRQIVRKTGCRVKIVKRAGAPVVLSRYRRRIPLAVYLLLAAVMIGVCSNIVWDVDIKASGTDEEALTRAILREAGVYPGAWLRNVDTKEVSAKLLIGIDGIKWANVYKHGTMISVELLPAESYADGDAMIDGPRDLVAQKDALIKKIVVERGTAVAMENTVVLAGETLIEGLAYPIDEIYGTEPRTVSAKGEVIGIVRYSAYAPIESAVSVYTLSGRTAVYKSISILGKQIPLPFSGGKLFAVSGSEKFENYNTVVSEEEWKIGRSHRLPVSIVTEERSETVEHIRELSGDEAEEYALFNAMRFLDDKIPETAEIVKTGREIREIDGVSCVYIWAECEEKIGTYVRRSDQVPAPDTEEDIANGAESL